MEDRGLTLKGEITMMKAIKNFMDKPITYGGYAKMCIGASTFGSRAQLLRRVHQELQ